MNEEEYLAARVDDQINWYDRKSQQCQKMFKRLSCFEIVAAAAIPIVAGFGNGIFPVALIAGILGALIAIAAAMQSLNQYQKNWTQYRTSCASLKHEKFLFLTKAEPYHEDDPFRLFVNRVEGLIAQENSAWSRQAAKKVEKG